MTKTEAWTQSIVRLEAPRAGVTLWRNNVGVLPNPGGRPVRFGLGNDSPDVNASLKSGDLIGIRPIVITPDMVGQVIGQFVSRECKRPGWSYNPRDPREVAQMNWMMLVNRLGGDANFVTGEGSFG